MSTKKTPDSAKSLKSLKKCRDCIEGVNGGGNVRCTTCNGSGYTKDNNKENDWRKYDYFLP